MVQIADSSFFEQVSESFKTDDPDIAKKEREAARVSVVQLMYHAIARSAFEELMELTTDDLILEIVGPNNSPFNGRWKGREEVLAAVKKNFSLVADQRPTMQSVVAQGDIVIVVARETGRMKETGKQYDVHWMQEYLF